MVSLFIIRTPLQSWLAEDVKRRENVSSYDLLYLTVEDSTEDRLCFERLSGNAIESQYIVIKPRQPDLIHQVDLALKLRMACRNRRRFYDKVFLASFECHGINALSVIVKPREIVTFDDGTANINLNGKYSADSMSRREKIYRSLLGGVSNHAFVNMIARHYTIFGDADHVMPSDRLIHLDPLVSGEKRHSTETVRYFIGQPLEQVLTFPQIARLKNMLIGEGIDWYVSHPRERSRLELGEEVEILEKQGEIAERAIELHAAGRNICLYGWFSTVMFTMRPIALRRVVFLARDDANTPEFRRVATQADCEVIEF